MKGTHLIGAYGMMWDKHEVNWNPGTGSNSWQLLGRVNTNRPQLRICDFRRAHGFYVLFDEFRATYVGLARGQWGIGARLRRHVRSREGWTRFCWFSIDDVRPGRIQGWSDVRQRATLPQMSSEKVLMECESLLITILGSKDQNAMRFQHASEWEQLRSADFLPGGIGRRVDPMGFTDPQFGELARDSGV